MGDPEDDTLDGYWGALQLPKRRAADTVLEAPSDLGPVWSWARDLGGKGKNPLLTLPGNGQRAALEEACGLDGRYTIASPGVGVPGPFVEGILDELMRASDLSVEGPIREMADKYGHIAHDVYRLLWEGRFLLREDAPAYDTFVTRMAGWLGGGNQNGYVDRVLSSQQEQVGALCFLTSLAAQNGVFKRAIILFEGVALIEDRRLAKEFVGVLAQVRRWSLMARCPLGIMLGLTATRSDLVNLRRLNQNLSAEVVAGLAWTKTT